MPLYNRYLRKTSKCNYLNVQKVVEENSQLNSSKSTPKTVRRYSSRRESHSKSRKQIKRQKWLKDRSLKLKKRKIPMKSLSGKNRVKNGVKCLVIMLILKIRIKYSNRKLMTESNVHLVAGNLIRRPLNVIFLVVSRDSSESDIHIHLFLILN